MSRTKEEFTREKAKMTGVKASITRSCKTVERLCTKLEEMLLRPMKNFQKQQQERQHRTSTRTEG
jgi:hypothetical protein